MHNCEKSEFNMVHTIVSLLGLLVSIALLVVGKDIRRPILMVAGLLVLIGTILFWLH